MYRYTQTFPNNLQRNLITVCIRDITFGVRWAACWGEFSIEIMEITFGVRWAACWGEFSIEIMEINTQFDRLLLPRFGEFPNCLRTGLKLQNRAVQ